VNTNHSFLRLEDLLLAPPLPAIVSLLTVLGTLNLSTLGARWLKSENKTPAELAAVFVLTTGLLAALVHAIAWVGYACLPILRGLAATLAALGVLELTKWKPRKTLSLIREYWSAASRVERCALIVSLLILGGLFAAALGPVTDADSLEYHLAVPLDWLRHGEAYPRPDWFSARYVGLGESLTLLGLAAGTDGLSAAFQAAGLVVALLGVAALAKTKRDQLFAVVFVIACPGIATLIAAQKPQLLPAAALTVAIVILIKHFKTFNLSTALVAFGCAAFAMASKHSFLLTGTVVVFVGLLAAVRAQRFPLAILVLAGCFAILTVPVFARNFVFYGDPISPLLERWRPGGNPAISAVAAGLREEGGERITLRRLARLPLDLVITSRLGLLHEGLGIGVLGFLLALRARGPTRQLLLASLAAFVLIAAFAPLKPRYFVEPYLWSAAALGSLAWHPLKSLFLTALTAQAALVTVVAMYLAISLFPGALTQTWRDHVMSLMAPGYAEAKWLDAMLPPDALVLEEFRYRAFLPRPFIVGQVAAILGERPVVLGDRLVFLKDVPDWKQQLIEFLKEKKVTVLVSPHPIENPHHRWLAENYGTPIAGPAEFPSAARSPFNRGNSTSWIVTSLSVDGPPYLRMNEFSGGVSNAGRN
jgi:hypothetical protein